MKSTGIRRPVRNRVFERLATILKDPVSDIRGIDMEKENLYLCMGSACHQMGVYEVLPKLQELMKEYKLENHVELKGSFCLETCSSGIVMKYKGQHFINISPQNIEEKFIGEILPMIQERNLPLNS